MPEPSSSALAGAGLEREREGSKLGISAGALVALSVTGNENSSVIEAEISFRKDASLPVSFGFSLTTNVREISSFGSKLIEFDGLNKFMSPPPSKEAFEAALPIGAPLSVTIVADASKAITPPLVFAAVDGVKAS